MKVEAQAVQIPLSGAQWAAKSEAYASLISEHLSADTVWLDAGCGSRLLEADMEPLEDWLASHCKTIVGMDVSVTSHRNIKSLVQGSLYDLPFGDNSFDLITCRMVVEHLARPRHAFAECARCLRPGGAIVAITPNLRNYAIFGNAVATKVLPEKLRRRIVHASDSRADEDIFPVDYKANTMPRLIQSLNTCGLQVHERFGLRQQRPYWRKHPSLEKILMKLTPIYVLLVCAHKVVAKSVSPVGPMLLPIAKSRHLPQNPPETKRI
ncbi:MAG: class I SAM-dependent methyltransferase [Terriglobales bacterium]|jgi:SAM-dependent methyltransferase